MASLGHVDAALDRRTLNYREHVLHTKTHVSLVFVSDHESGMGKLIVEHLGHEGFGIHALPLATGTIQRLEQIHPALVIMAISRGPALALCRAIRWAESLARTPLILLAANPSEEERILCLESGADDYIAGSSSGREVVARVRAVMRRFARQQRRTWMPHISPPFLQSFVGAPSPTIKTGDIEINPLAMKISVRGSEIVTTNLEFRFLYYLVQNQARVFTREQLLDAVWSSRYVELRSVDACVRRLRRKIEMDPLHPVYLRTVRGAGYSFLVGPAQA